MRSPLRRSAGTRRSSPYPSTAGMRLRSPCGGWMPCGATVRRPWWSCSTAIAPTNMPRASWPISWRRGDSCPWLRPLSSASTPTPRRVGRSLRGGPTGTTAPRPRPSGASWRRNSPPAGCGRSMRRGCRPCATGCSRCGGSCGSYSVTAAVRSGIRNGWRSRPRPTGARTAAAV